MLSYLIDSENKFFELKDRWESLLLETIDANIFLSFDWLYSWWIAYKPDAILHIIVVENDYNEIVGIAPLMIKSVKKYGFSYRLLNFIGDGTFESDHMNFLVHHDQQQNILSCIFQHLHNCNLWDICQFNQIYKASTAANIVLEWVRDEGYKYEVEEILSPICKLPNNFELMLQKLSPRFRTKLRSTARKIHEKYKVEFGLYENASELDDRLQTLFRLHESRWRAKGEPGSFADARRREFYHILSQKLLVKDQLRFFYLKLDDTIVSLEYCMQYDGIVYLLQEGFDYNFANENIGNMLRSKVFEHMISQNVIIYDFLAYDSRHKKNWSNGYDNDLRIEIIRDKLKNKIYYYIPRALRKVKNFIRKTLPHGSVN